MFAKQGKWHDTANMHFRAIDVHVELQLFTRGFDIFKTFLVVGSSSTHPDLSLVLIEFRRTLPKSANDSLER